MIDGDAREFIEGLYYGDERFFFFDGEKYFLQGYFSKGKPMLELYVMENPKNHFAWRSISKNGEYPVKEFESAPIFNGKTFWEAEQEIQWVDC